MPVLTASAAKGYIHFSSLPAGVAKLAYAADSKSAGTWSRGGSSPPSGIKLTS